MFVAQEFALGLGRRAAEYFVSMREASEAIDDALVMLREAKRILSVFRSYSDTPYVIAANKQDMDDAWPPEDLRFALGVDEQVKIVPCVGRDREAVKQVLLELLYTILTRMDAEGVLET